MKMSSRRISTALLQTPCLGTQTAAHATAQARKCLELLRPLVSSISALHLDLDQEHMLTHLIQIQPSCSVDTQSMSREAQTPAASLFCLLTFASCSANTEI